MAKKIKQGKPIEELVKGSLEYTMSLIKSAFSAQFPNRDTGPYFWIEEIFSDYVIIKSYSDSALKSDEYYKAAYTKSGDVYTFVARDQWEVVELAYQAQTGSGDPSEVSSDQGVSEGKAEGGRRKAEGKKRGQRFEERVNAAVVLEEGEAGKPRRIKIEGAITADVVNGNGRRYPVHVVEAAIAELRGHLNESAGQGRAIQVLGEAEHPSDKGGRANLLETVTKWEAVDMVGSRVDLTGRILETSKGRDILALMEGGVQPGVSLRGYGDGKYVKAEGGRQKAEGGRMKDEEKIFEVSELHITGFDLVLEPSFENAAQLIESINQSSKEDEMTLEELLKLLKERPDLFKGITEAQVKEMGEAQLKVLEGMIRSALGIDGKADIAESLRATAEKAKKFDENQARAGIEAAIAKETKDLPFGEKLNGIFIESFKGMEFTTAEAVAKFAESQRRQFSQLAAADVLKGIGFDEKTKSVKVLGSVLERETGIPEYGKVSFELMESVRKGQNRAKRAMQERAESPAAVFTENLLKRFDQLYMRKLIEESRLFEEAEATSDLNLPYSVSRAVIAEAMPNLVAANIFDVGVMEQSPMNIFYEAFSGETGYEVAITDEVETAGAEDTWYALAHANIVPGTVTVTSNPAGTTYTEGTDYVIDYELGKIRLIAAGAVDANDVLVDYTYHATRQGEGAAIERAKVTLSYQTITAAADRLADDINHEAIVFSRSQLGWDAVGRTMANLINNLRREIDRRLIEKALAASLSVASNSGGTWTSATDPWSELVEKIGYAKVKVAKRYYEPTGALLSTTNADLLSNWDGFRRDGFPNAVLNAAGFVGSAKGLLFYESTEMRDGWGMAFNRGIVMHRVYQPMTVKGPFPKYSSDKLVAAEQYYAEEYNASLAPVPGKAAHVVIA